MDKEKIKEIEKIHYDVVIEILSPTTMKFKVWAETPEEAYKMIETGTVAPVFVSKPKIIRNYIKAASVFLSGTVNKLFSK
jgi:hypothetical protein